MQKKTTVHFLITKESKFQKKREIENCLFATGGKEKVISDFIRCSMFK